MQSALGNVEDLAGILHVIRIATQSGVSHIPQSRSYHTNRQGPDQGVPNMLTILAAMNQFTLGNPGSDNHARHDQHAIPAQSKSDTKKFDRKYDRIDQKAWAY